MVHTRLGVPSTQENALHKRSPRGPIWWIRDGDLLLVKWMDGREVSVCTTVDPVSTGDIALRWQRKEDGHFERVSVPRPTAVTEYNKYMGGVDTSDQMLGTNLDHRKTRRWDSFPPSSGRCSYKQLHHSQRVVHQQATEAQDSPGLPGGARCTSPRCLLGYRVPKSRTLSCPYKHCGYGKEAEGKHRKEAVHRL